MSDVATNVVPTDEEGWEVIHEESGTPIDLSTEGEKFEGTYVGMKVVETEDLNNPGEMRPSNLYTFEQDGKKHTLWGSWAIDEAFKAIEPGRLCRIVFCGKIPIDGGKRTVKEYRVLAKN